MNIYYNIVISFIVYFFVSFVFKQIKVRNFEESLQTTKGLLLLNVKHIIGVLLFGFLFFLAESDYLYLLFSIQLTNGILIVLAILTMLLSGVLAFKSATRISLKKNTLITKGLSSILLYFSIRVFFLVCYEFFFRGIVLFTLLYVFGLYKAIIITTVLYVIIHGFDSRKEIIGSIPFGIVLCLFSYFSKSVIIACLIHLTLSMVYEISVFNSLTIKNRT